MRNYSAKDVDSYIKSADEKARPHLRTLRELINSTVPNVEEKISWGVPFYRYHGLLVGFSAFQNHVSFGLIFVLQNKDRKTLEKMGYKTGKKTIQIRFDQKIPTTIIKEILKNQAKVNKAKSKKN